MLIILKLFLSQGQGRSALRPRFILILFVQYWQDAGIRTRVAAAAARCATITNIEEELEDKAKVAASDWGKESLSR